jgi:hypothetical protein
VKQINTTSHNLYELQKQTKKISFTKTTTEKYHLIT